MWSSAGITPESAFTTALRGQSPAIAADLDGLVLPICAAPDPAVDPGFPQIRRMDRSARLALAAARPAVAMANLADVDPTRVAIIVGNSRGPVHLSAREPARCRPTQAAHSAIGAVSGALSLAFGFRGPCLTLSATCASGAHAIAMGAMLVRDGAVHAALVGGAEAPLTAALGRQVHAAGIVAPPADPARACRPFARDRQGTVPGEGAAFLVLESAESARARGGKPLATILGTGWGAESHTRAGARPDGAGLVRVLEDALQQAGVQPEDVAHVNAHGTGTRVNDAAESAAFRRVFGSAALPPITSTKPITGHGFGAAAALEAVLAVATLRHRWIPPTANFSTPDEALGIIPVHGEAIPLRGDIVVSTSLGFWGNVGAVVFGRA